MQPVTHTYHNMKQVQTHICTMNAQIQHFEIQARHARAAPRAISIYTVCYGNLSAEAAQHKHSDGLQADRVACSHAAPTLVVQESGQTSLSTYMHVQIAALLQHVLFSTFRVATARELPADHPGDTTAGSCCASSCVLLSVRVLSRCWFAFFKFVVSSWFLPAINTK